MKDAAVASQFQEICVSNQKQRSRLKGNMPRNHIQSILKARPVIGSINANVLMRAF